MRGVYGAVVAGAAVVALTAACSDDPAPVPGVSPSRPAAATATPSTTATGPAASDTLTPDLDTYTDRGDGCAQIVSAIGYADEDLLPLGQEPYQQFGDDVRSRLAAVGGTIALELDDLPSAAVGRQARRVQPLAERAGALTDEADRSATAARATTLLRYRIEAARLVLACRESAPPATTRPAVTGAGPAPSPRRSVKLSTPATEGPTSP